MSPQELERTVREHLPGDVGGTSLVVGVSGGADSVALLLLLASLQNVLSFRLRAVHINHHLRGAASDADEQWTVELCRQLRVPVDVHRADVAGRVTTTGESLEEAARKMRYALLTDSARLHGCRYVAVAHTADDQVETVLHHILRGTGLAGLQGMSSLRPLSSPEEQEDPQRPEPAGRSYPPSSFFSPQEKTTEPAETIFLIRPLLTVRRRQIEEYLRSRNQPVREDATNAERRFTRNRIRNELLPLLRRDFNPKVDEALLRLSHQAAEAMCVLQQTAEECLADALLETHPRHCRLKVDVLQKAAPYVTRLALVRLWQHLHWPRQKMSAADWHRLEEVVRGEGAVSLPGGIEARRRGDVLLLQQTR